MKKHEPSAPDNLRAFPSETAQRVGAIDNAVLRDLHERRVQVAERRTLIRCRLGSVLIGVALGAGVGLLLVFTLLRLP